MKYRLQQIYNNGEQKDFPWSQEDIEISEYFGEFLTEMGVIHLLVKKINGLSGSLREAFISTLHKLISGQEIYFLSTKVKMDLETLEIKEV